LKVYKAIALQTLLNDSEPFTVGPSALSLCIAELMPDKKYFISSLKKYLISKSV
jgi:hypothetical protein